MNCNEVNVDILVVEHDANKDVDDMIFAEFEWSVSEK